MDRNTHPLILLVEDDDHCRSSIGRYLIQAGYHVVDAPNGATALTIAKHLHETNLTLDLVITDILMPQVDGIELCQKLRQIVPSTKIIAITGGGSFGQENVGKMIRWMGIDKIMYKPFTQDQLFQSISDLISVEQKMA